jgi:hypothetical protein
MNANRHFLEMVVFLLSFAMVGLTSFGCGDDDDDDDDTDDSGGSDNTTDDDAADCGSAELLPGVWIAGSITMEIFDDLTYHTVGASQSSYDVYGSIATDVCAVLFTDTSGQGACPATQVGEYTYAVTETTLTTNLVDDPCAGRVFGLDGTEFQRQS